MMEWWGMLGLEMRQKCTLMPGASQLRSLGLHPWVGTVIPL